MGLMDDAKAKLQQASDDVKNAVDDVTSKADITKQRVEGEVDKAKGDDLKGEAKIKSSQVRDKLS